MERPSTSTTGRFPIDIHACSQAILHFIAFSSIDPAALERAWKTFHWTARNMAAPDGSFYYQRHRMWTNRTLHALGPSLDAPRPAPGSSSQASRFVTPGWIMMLAESKMRIWIDLDNSPHAHFFPPIIRRLEEAGYAVELTARRFGQVEEIARSHGLDYVVIGQHRTPHFFLTRAMATVVPGVAACLVRSQRSVPPSR